MTKQSTRPYRTKTQLADPTLPSTHPVNAIAKNLAQQVNPSYKKLFNQCAAQRCTSKKAAMGIIVELLADAKDPEKTLTIQNEKNEILSVRVDTKTWEIFQKMTTSGTEAKGKILEKGILLLADEMGIHYD